MRLTDVFFSHSEVVVVNFVRCNHHCHVINVIKTSTRAVCDLVLLQSANFFSNFEACSTLHNLSFSSA